VTDPFLVSAVGGEPVTTARPSGGTNKELARRMRVPPDLLDDLPPDVAARMEQYAANRDVWDATWSWLCDEIAGTLEAGGFRRHNSRGGSRGGYHIGTGVVNDGPLVSWSTTEYAGNETSAFERTVEAVMNPALLEILQTCGFEARMIPEAEDFGGSILVTGRYRDGGTVAARRHVP